MRCRVTNYRKSVRYLMLKYFIRKKGNKFVEEERFFAIK